MTAVVVLATGLVAGGTIAQTPAPPADEKPTREAAPAAKEPRSPMAKPVPKPQGLGPEHKILAGFAGHWKSKATVVPATPKSFAESTEGTPSAPKPKTEGTAEGKLVMDGRFAQVNYQALRDGKPYEAMILWGFDNVVNRYTSIWIDNTGNAIIRFVGTYDAAKKQLTMTTHYSDQATRRLTIAKTVATFVDANSWVYDEYVSHAVGEAERHTLSITFNRG
jgi:hypothetical protein